MTNILDLPEEILYMIFKKCEHEDLNQFQRVCRSWYIPAHITFLKDVEIPDIPAIQLFIDSIDCNPNLAYLKAVKRIKFKSFAKACTFQFDDQLNQKLFYRFPNLQKVTMDEPNFLRHFTDDMCKTFLKNCPQLEIFMADSYISSAPGYRDLIYKAKLLITEINLDLLEYASTPVDVTQFLSSFPRLRKITGFENNQLNNFNQVLQIMEHAPNLSSIYMRTEDHDSENIAEKELTLKAKAERDKLIKQLARIDTAELYYSVNFCVNSLNFALKYLTGIEDLTLYNGDDGSWTEAHTETFYNLVSNVHKLKDYHIRFCYMEQENLTKCFPIAVQKVFSLITKLTRTLTLHLEDWFELSIETCYSDTNISICLNNELTSSEIAQHYFKTAYENVQKFDLKISKYSLGQNEAMKSLHDYNIILGQMPHLKEMILDITNDFVDKDDQGGCELKLPGVEDLTLRATIDAKFQSLFDGYYFALPNLRRLTLFYYSGTFDKSVSEFRVKLSKYSLESLHFDLTPVRLKSAQVLDSKPDGFFVLEVEMLKASERHLYKVSFDLSSVRILDYSNLKGYICGEDYLFVRITTRSLQSLTLFTVPGFRKKHEDNYYDSELTDLPQVVIYYSRTVNGKLK